MASGLDLIEEGLDIDFDVESSSREVKSPVATWVDEKEDNARVYYYNNVDPTYAITVFHTGGQPLKAITADFSFADISWYFGPSNSHEHVTDYCGRRGSLSNGSVCRDAYRMQLVPAMKLQSGWKYFPNNACSNPVRIHNSAGGVLGIVVNDSRGNHGNNRGGFDVRIRVITAPQ